MIKITLKIEGMDLDTGPNYLPVDEMHEARIYELEKTVKQLFSTGLI